MWTALGRGPPEWIVKPELNDGLKLNVDTSTVLYNKVEDQQTQVGPHMKIEQEIGEWKCNKWIEELKTDPKFKAYHEKLTGMMTGFESKSEGHLGRINDAKHHIELSSDKIRPIHCVTYKAGPRARESEITEIDRMIKMGVIDRAETECAFPIVFAPKSMPNP